MAFDVDYTDLEEMRMVRSRDVNLFFDPVTGYNIDPAKGRPNPAWAQNQWLTSDGRTQTRNIASSFQRRFSHNFQANVTYTKTLSMKDNTTGFGYFANNQFNPDGDWGNVRRHAEPHVQGERHHHAAARLLPRGVLLLRFRRTLRRDELDHSVSASRARTA